MTRHTLILTLTAASAILLISAWGFEYLGYAPCKLCYWQRYPHMAAVGIGILAAATRMRILPWCGALATAATGAVGVYHSGVERKLWEGPTSCTSSSIGGLNTDELFEQIMTAPLIRCDEIPWQMAGLTMANLNAVFSLALAVLWIVAARKAD